MAILIPAYEPDDKLVRLIESIRATRRDQLVVVVDDGSGPVFAATFDAVRSLGCDVIGHARNRGEGFALKRGFARIADRHPGHDVVCADCDGQHAIVDILRIADRLADHRDGVVLGARQFAGDVPVRSRFGNTLTRFVFERSTGLRLQDTQTGLRGYPANMLAWLQSIGGDRFEYELEVLLAAKAAGLAFHEIPIETIYIEGNESSHFHPILDSVRVYVPFVRFSLSSLAAFAIDAALFFVMMALTGQLALSVVTACVVSATVNFRTNRRLVFAGSRRRRASSAVRYAALVLAIMAANYGLLNALTGLSFGLVPSKLITETALFGASYWMQRRFVFGAAAVSRHADDEVSTSQRAAEPSRVA